MGILMVMLGIAVPMILSGTSKTALNRSARNVIVELKAARQLAVSRNMQFRIVFSLGAIDTMDREYRVNTSSDWLADPVRATMKIDSRVNITNPNEDFIVVFNPNGSSIATEICIENFADSADRRKVKVYSITGRVEVSNSC